MYPGFCGRGHAPTVRALTQGASNGLRWSRNDCRKPGGRSCVFVWNTSTGVSEGVVPYLISIRYDIVDYAVLGPFPTRSGGFIFYYLAPVPQPPRCSRGRLLNLQGASFWMRLPLSRGTD